MYIRYTVMAFQERIADSIGGGIWLAGGVCSVTVLGKRVGGSWLTIGGYRADLC
jgi:hypothetical protein